MNLNGAIRWPVLGLMLFLWNVLPVQAQYTLDEIGANLGGGMVLYNSAEAGSMAGPAVNANAFYGHYFCGKNYGIHMTAGAVAYFPQTANGMVFLDDPLAGQSSANLVALDLGFYFKIKARDYHRRREWAVFVGPKAQLPFLQRYQSELGSGSLSSKVSKVYDFIPAAHLSVQFRRPAPGKKCWFIQPGVEYSILPAYRTVLSGDVRPIYFFLNFGFAFWDKRG